VRLDLDEHFQPFDVVVAGIVEVREDALLDFLRDFRADSSTPRVGRKPSTRSIFAPLTR
jgi:hypothetical protein